MKKMNCFLISTLIMIMSYNAFGQIGWTKAKLIEKEGINYKEDKTISGIAYIVYKSTKYDEDEGVFEKWEVYYFDKNTNLVDEIAIIEPLSQVNKWVKTLNENFVKMDKLRWRNYAQGIDFILVIEDKIMKIVILDDNE